MAEDSGEGGVRARETGAAGSAVHGLPWQPAKRPFGSTIRDHLRVLAEGVGFVAQRVGATLLVWLLIGIALALPAGLYLVQTNLAGVADGWRAQAGLSVYFAPDLGTAPAELLAERLRATAGIDDVRVVTPEEALAEFRAYGDLSDALDLLVENPLPATLRASFAPRFPAAELAPLRSSLLTAEGVEEVVIEQTWLERIAAMSALIVRLGWTVAGILGVGAVLVTSSSVRLAIESRLDEVRVLKLVGATDGFIRRRFLYLGFMYGAGGALVGAMLVSGALFFLEPPLARLFGSYGETLDLEGFDAVFVLALLGVGGLLGVFGSWAACRQRLRNLDIFL